jgi:hypothetical protein
MLILTCAVHKASNLPVASEKAEGEDCAFISPDYCSITCSLCFRTKNKYIFFCIYFFSFFGVGVATSYALCLAAFICGAKSL